MPYQETIITRKNSAGKIFNRVLRNDLAGLKDYFCLQVNLEKYMKEQIYFVTKNVETLQSEFYSLESVE